MKLFLAAILCVAFTAALEKDEFLVSGVKSTSPHPFGLSAEILEGIPHDKCAVSIPVPGNDDSMSIVALGLNRAIWIRQYNGAEWSDWVSLNGTSSSGPSAIRDDKDQLHIFIRGVDGLIWHRFEKQGDWSDWMHLGNVKTTSGPVAVINSEGLISVFVLGSNKAVWINTQEGLADADGVCTSGKSFPTAEQESRPENAESIATTNSGFDEDSPNHKPVELVQVAQVAATEEDALRQSLVNNATAEANREWDRVEALKTSAGDVSEMKYVWSGWENLGGVWTSKPSVNINNEGLLSVYVRGVDRSMYYASQQTSAEHGLVWSDWEWLKGSFASAPKVSTINTADGMTVITARGVDKSFYMKKQISDYDGVEWSRWENIGGLWSSGPTVLSPMGDRLEVFGVGLDLSIWHKIFTIDDGEEVWSAPSCLQGRFSTGVGVAKDTSGLMKVFARGFDKKIWMKSEEPDSTNTAVWGNWTSLGGSVLPFPC